MSNKTNCTDDSLRLKDALKQLGSEQARSERNIRLSEALKRLTVEGKRSDASQETTIRECTIAGFLILAVVLISLWISG